MPSPRSSTVTSTAFSPSLCKRDQICNGSRPLCNDAHLLLTLRPMNSLCPELALTLSRYLPFRPVSRPAEDRGVGLRTSRSNYQMVILLNASTRPDPPHGVAEALQPHSWKRKTTSASTSQIATSRACLSASVSSCACHWASAGHLLTAPEQTETPHGCLFKSKCYQAPRLLLHAPPLKSGFHFALRAVMEDSLG